MKKHGLLLILIIAISTAIYAQQDYSDEYARILRHYHIKSGQLRFNATRLFFRGIKFGEVKNDTLRMFNDGDTPVTVSFKRLPAFLEAMPIPSSIPPKTEGIVVFTYNTLKKNEYGPTFDAFFMHTNDSIRSDKRISVSPNILEDFSGLTAEDRANAPKIEFSHEIFDFKKVKSGEKISHVFDFRNTGKSELIIRKTKASCGCTATHPEKTIIKPGESSKIEIIFNTYGREGKQRKTITVVCNDPEQPETILSIFANIIK